MQLAIEFDCGRNISAAKCTGVFSNPIHRLQREVHAAKEILQLFNHRDSPDNNRKKSFLLDVLNILFAEIFRLGST
jgi:hypothetical protein